MTQVWNMAPCMKFAWDYLRPKRYQNYAKAAALFSAFLSALHEDVSTRTGDDWMEFSGTMIDILVAAHSDKQNKQVGTYSCTL